jgi:hypothetical protein
MVKFKKRNRVVNSHRTVHFYHLLILLVVFFLGCSESSNSIGVKYPEGYDAEVYDADTEYKLNLRFHIMTDIIMEHTSGVSMESWVTTNDVSEIIIPEINAIWKQAKIIWVVESIIEEDVVKHNNYEESIAFIASTERNSDGQSDPARLPHLYNLMQPDNRSTEDDLDKNLYHLYLFPFIGNTSQGNAMQSFSFNSVVGTWTNKHNNGGDPEKTLLIESHSSFDRGSLSRTMAHEIGHVLGLKHNQCDFKCLMGVDGYFMTSEQIKTARLEALRRL